METGGALARGEHEDGMKRLAATDGVAEAPQWCRRLSASPPYFGWAAESRQQWPCPCRGALRPMLAADSTFAANLYGQLSLRSGNLFCSPASIRLALAMAYAGASGDTALEMQRALALGPESHAGFAELLRDWEKLAHADDPCAAERTAAESGQERHRPVPRPPRRSATGCAEVTDDFRCVERMEDGLRSLPVCVGGGLGSFAPLRKNARRGAACATRPWRRYRNAASHDAGEIRPGFSGTRLAR